jgi:hypothetical protein
MSYTGSWEPLVCNLQSRANSVCNIRLHFVKGKVFIHVANGRFNFCTHLFTFKISSREGWNMDGIHKSFLFSSITCHGNYSLTETKGPFISYHEIRTHFFVLVRHMICDKLIWCSSFLKLVYLLLWLSIPYPNTNKREPFLVNCSSHWLRKWFV